MEDGDVVQGLSVSKFAMFPVFAGHGDDVFHSLYDAQHVVGFRLQVCIATVLEQRVGDHEEVHALLVEWVGLGLTFLEGLLGGFTEEGGLGRHERAEDHVGVVQTGEGVEPVHVVAEVPLEARPVEFDLPVGHVLQELQDLGHDRIQVLLLHFPLDLQQ